MRPSGAHDVPQQILQHEAPHARAGVDDRQDEQRLEHDREVIPEADHRLAAARAARRCAPCPAPAKARRRCGEQRLLADVLRQRRHVRHASPGSPRPMMVATAAAGVAPTMPAGEFTAKYTPGCSTHAAIIAMIATKLSSSIEP